MAKKTPPPTPQKPTPVPASFPNLEGRKQVHDGRIPPLDEVIDGLTAVREAVEAQKKQLRESISQLDAERKGLALQIERLRQEKEQLEREDEAFAEEHRRHDAVLKERIEKAYQLAEEILALVKS